MSRARRRSLASLLAVLALATGSAFAPGRAHAAPRQLTILDPHEATGFYGERARSSSLRELDRLGVDVVRIILYWRDIAPAPLSAREPRHFNPADPRDYSRFLRKIDRTVRQADRLGIKVMLVPTGRFHDGRIPRWARLRPRSDSNEPDPHAFAALLEALGTRYGGRFDPDGDGPARKLPRVQIFSLWNEPNSGAFLQPLEQGPEIYRRLVLAGVRGLHRARWRGRVLAGETSAGGSRQTPPVEFMRRVLCMPPGFDGPPACPRLPVDGWAHHPYSLGLAPWEAPPDPGNVSIGTLGRLTGPLAAARRYGALPSRAGLWLTEYGYETVPDPNGVALNVQSEYDSIAERLAFENPLVESFPQYLLRDDPSAHGTYAAFETGLRFHDGKKKPAWLAFRTPLAVSTEGSSAAIWGRVRPARKRSAVEIRFLDTSGTEGDLARIRTDGSGYFGLAATAVPGRRWAVAWHGHQGPWIRGYDFP